MESLISDITEMLSNPVIAGIFGGVIGACLSSLLTWLIINSKGQARLNQANIEADERFNAAQSQIEEKSQALLKSEQALAEANITQSSLNEQLKTADQSLIQVQNELESANQQAAQHAEEANNINRATQRIAGLKLELKNLTLELEKAKKAQNATSINTPPIEQKDVLPPIESSTASDKNEKPIKSEAVDSLIQPEFEQRNEGTPEPTPVAEERDKTALNDALDRMTDRVGVFNQQIKKISGRFKKP